jgi:GTPase SAR1 family protein
MQYMHSIFCSTYDPTIEDSYMKQICYKENMYMLHILDTGLAEICLADIKVCRGIICVFSLMDIGSLAAVLTIYKHVTELRGECLPAVLVGNKCDLFTERTKVTEEAERAAACLNDVNYIEASAKVNQNILEIFNSLVCRIDMKETNSNKNKLSCVML